MVAEPSQGLTRILGRARAEDERARGEFVALKYDEPHRVASRLMRRERAGHTLLPTAVVHEAVIRLLSKTVFDKVAGLMSGSWWRGTLPPSSGGR